MCRKPGGRETRSIGWVQAVVLWHRLENKCNLEEEHVNSVVKVKRALERLMSLKLEVGGVMLDFVSVCAPQVGSQKRKRNSGVHLRKW